jgi:hypothetical protein
MEKLTELQKSVIEKKLKIGINKYIVMLNVMGRKDFEPTEKNHNVYCINENFEIIWEIQPDEGPFAEIDPFVYMKINEQGEYVSFSYSGFEYKIDIETGHAKIIAWHK